MKTLKKICSLKNTVKRLERQDADGEKIFANHMSVKELVSRIYKQLSKNPIC